VSAFTDAREALAGAVTAAGLECQPYPPDAPSAPQAWIDTLSVDYAQGAGWSFCMPGAGTAAIVTVGQRHDKAASTRALEDLIPLILAQLDEVVGVRVTGIQSGTVQITGQDMPSVIFTTEFALQG
jgi:hypothetical protein